jgi:hypothetical protein
MKEIRANIELLNETELKELTSSHSLILGNEPYDDYKTFKAFIPTEKYPENPESVRKYAERFTNKDIDIDHNTNEVIGRIVKSEWNDGKKGIDIEYSIYNKAKSYADMVDTKLKGGEPVYMSPSYRVIEGMISGKYDHANPKAFGLCVESVPDDYNCMTLNHSKLKRGADMGNIEIPEARYNELQRIEGLYLNAKEDISNHSKLKTDFADVDKKYKELKTEHSNLVSGLAESAGLKPEEATPENLTEAMKIGTEAVAEVSKINAESAEKEFNEFAKSFNITDEAKLKELKDNFEDAGYMRKFMAEHDSNHSQRLKIHDRTTNHSQTMTNKEKLAAYRASKK